MDNLVQKVNFQLPGSPEIEMYMYGEATLEANQEMQPVLEKLYKCEEGYEDITSILGDLTGHVENYLDDNRAWFLAKEVLEYIDNMWAVFGMDSKKNRQEALKGVSDEEN